MEEELIKLFGLKKSKRGGYEKVSVEQSIIDLVTKYENAKAEKELYKKEYSKLIHQHNVMKDQFNEISSLTTRNQSRDDISRLALKEANALIEKAKKNADSILKEALEQVTIVSKDINNFQEEARLYRSSILKMNQRMLETIDSSHVYFLLKENLEEESTDVETPTPMTPSMNLDVDSFDDDVYIDDQPFGDN